MFKRIFIGIFGFCLWTLGLQEIGQRQAITQEHETLSAQAWLDTLSRATSAHILFGSSNIAFSLDCDRLDASCADEKLAWYNLGQRGMQGYELLDFTMRFLKQLPPTTALKTIYIEATPEVWSKKNWNWRNAEVLSSASIIESSILAATHSDQKWKHWKALESMCQGMMMKSVTPVHAILYPSSHPSRKGTKGFFKPPNRPHAWVPNAQEEEAMAPSIENQSAWDAWLTSEGNLPLTGDSLELEATYPFQRLQSVVEHCRDRDIEVRMLFIPTSSTIHLFDSLASITGNTPILLGMSGEVRPFVTPEWMNDVRHLNAKGIEQVSDELGLTACQTYN